GLGPALEGVAARATVTVRLLELPMGRYDASVESTVYYVVAEAVANAPKHDGLRVEVVDDGIGGAAESPDSGLQGLRDRVEAVGGRFALDSTRSGTRITALVPTATP